MTTKQILFSTLILGAISNIALPMEKKAKAKKFDQGIHTKLNDHSNCNLFESFQPFGCTENDDVMVIEKLPLKRPAGYKKSTFESHGTIKGFKLIMLHQHATEGEIEVDRIARLAALNDLAKHAETNNAIYCPCDRTGNTIPFLIFNTQKIADCEKITIIKK